MPTHAVPTSPWMSALCLAAGMALVTVACGSDGGDDTSREEPAATEPSEGGESTGASEVEYTEPPTDLTSDEVCALLDEATISEHLEAEVTSETAGTRQPDCTWMYKLPGGPATNLQVQVMSMDQTDGEYGTEALASALDMAPQGSEVGEVESLGVPNGTYEFGASTIVLAVDDAGRVFTVTAHSESPEEGRIALVGAVADALSENHPPQG